MSDEIDFASFIEATARKICGKTNPTLSTKAELRFGARGSLSVVIAGSKQGTWFDHELGIGGGVLDLLRHKLGLVKADAIGWLRGVSASAGEKQKADARAPKNVDLAGRI